MEIKAVSLGKASVNIVSEGYAINKTNMTLYQPEQTFTIDVIDILPLKSMILSMQKEPENLTTVAEKQKITLLLPSNSVIDKSKFSFSLEARDSKLNIADYMNYVITKESGGFIDELLSPKINS